MDRTSEIFNETLKLAAVGGDISQEELSDAWGYASDGINEMYRFAKTMMAGYKHQQGTIKRKDSIIEEKIRQIEEKNRIIWVLNQKLRALGKDGGQDAGV